VVCCTMLGAQFCEIDCIRATHTLSCKAVGSALLANIAVDARREAVTAMPCIVVLSTLIHCSVVTVTPVRN
jgi:hypothetical protein